MVLVAALVESHPAHKRAFPWLKKATAKEFDMIVAAQTQRLLPLPGGIKGRFHHHHHHDHGF
jgi:hypothetical protein